MADKIERKSVELDIELDKGADLSIQLTWRSGEGDIYSSNDNLKPSLVDISDWSAKFIIRPYSEDDVELDNIEITSSDGDIILGGDTGEISLIIPAEDTALYEWSRGVYVLLMTSDQNETIALARGRIKAYNLLEDLHDERSGSAGYNNQ